MSADARTSALSQSVIDDARAEIARARARRDTRAHLVTLSVAALDWLIADATATLTAECDRWRSEFQATERTAQVLDKQWERLAGILGMGDDEPENLWEEMVDRVATLRAQLAEAAKDAERLDWLDANCCNWTDGYDAEDRPTGEPISVEIDFEQEFPQARVPSHNLREAIDAARAEKADA